MEETYIDTPMHTQLMLMADDHNYSNTNNTSFGSMEDSSTYNSQETNFELSDFFEFNDWFGEDIQTFSSFSAGYNPQVPNYMPNEVVASSSAISSSNSSFSEGTINRGEEGGSGKEKQHRKKVAFKTKSEIEILDDGFKWRKYGKKMVKNSPNPRNYYRCSVEGCPVKKRVERDKEDPRYVVTTYEGIHNHQGPTN